MRQSNWFTFSSILPFVTIAKFTWCPFMAISTGWCFWKVCVRVSERASVFFCQSVFLHNHYRTKHEYFCQNCHSHKTTTHLSGRWLWPITSDLNVQIWYTKLLRLYYYYWLRFCICQKRNGKCSILMLPYASNLLWYWIVGNSFFAAYSIQKFTRLFSLILFDSLTVSNRKRIQNGFLFSLV